MGSRNISSFDGSKNAVGYYIPTPSGKVYSTSFDTLVARYNDEYVRRNQSNPGFSSPSGVITASTLRAIADGLNNLSGQSPTANGLGDPGQDVSASTISQINQGSGFSGAGGGAPASVSSGNIVYASAFTDLANAVINAGSQCLCNCNYCTCNCNYCTCNCDYSCTCNCNY